MACSSASDWVRNAWTAIAAKSIIFMQCRDDTQTQLIKRGSEWVLRIRPITHADESRGSKAFVHVWLCVCPHDRTTITELATGIVHR